MSYVVSAFDCNIAHFIVAIFDCHNFLKIAAATSSCNLLSFVPVRLGIELVVFFLRSPTPHLSVRSSVEPARRLPNEGESFHGCLRRCSHIVSR